MDRSIGDMPTLPGGDEPSWRGILQPGSFFGRYKVHCFLGRGGMGEVYEVEHELDGTHYAMKVLSSEIPQTPENIRRFEREAKVMARLQHPNVVSVDYFDETDGKYWFRMELARGIEEGVVTLGDLAAKNGGRIGQGLLVCLFEQILDGLSCAHEKGVIHRDLKPSNILLAHSDETAGGIVPKISDFGLVRLVGQDWLLKKTLISAQQSLKERGVEGTKDSQGLSTESLVGTYAYMSPEQKQRKEIDARSDIYAVGLMIYRLLTGYTNPGEKIRNKDSTLHTFWQRVIDQSVREDPKDRFASTAAMLVQIKRGHRVLASLDGKVSLQKCRAEFQAKRYYTANRYLDEAVMIFPNDSEVLGFRAFMREQLSTLRDLKSKMQDLRRQKNYEDALTVSEQFRAICIEDEDINKFIREYPQLITRERLRQLVEEASRLLEAEKYEAASQVAQKALSLDNENRQARQIHDQALETLQKMQVLQTREQVSQGLQKTRSLLKQRQYAQALDTLKHTPCYDSNHPSVVALRNACQAGLKKIKQYWDRAEKARASSDYQQAMSVLNEVLQSVAPEDPGTMARLHQLNREVKELSTALTDMDHAWKNKSFKGCLEAAERILALQPEHSKAQPYKLACIDKIQAIQLYVKKAEAYYQNQRYDEAIAAFKQTKKFYSLGKRGTEDDAATKTKPSVYSPEYKEILDRIATIRQAKTSMEQALQQAKERLEAGDLIETRLALDKYFELQTNGQEGLLLQNKLENLHRRATRMRWIRRSVTYLAVIIVIGLGLSYGTASLVRSHRMQKELEKSFAGLTFANLKKTQNDAGEQLTTLKQFRLIPLFSIKARWKNWKESLDIGALAWEDYAHGAYEEGRKKIENIPATEFRSYILKACDTFVQETNTSCADVNDNLVNGKYDDCVDTCNAFLLDYPQHRGVLDLLQKANKAQELERCVYDTNDLKSLSEYMGNLLEISPRHHDRQKLEALCIKRVKSKYDFWDQPLPKDANDIAEQESQCRRALEDLALFKPCHGYQALYETITDRRKNLEDSSVEGKLLAKAKSLINEGYWGKANQILDTLYTDQDEVARLKKIVTEKITELNNIITKTHEHIEQDYWFDAETTISDVWIVWKRDDTYDLLQKAKELETRINEVVQKERRVIREFLETFDQKSHDQVERFLQERIENNPDLVEVYAKWFVRLNRDAQDAIEQGKINTALNLLSRVLGNEKMISCANDERLKELLQNLKRTKAKAEKRDERQDEALAQTDKARTSQSNMQYPEALWHLHEALEIDPECDSAQNLQTQLQSRERVATQYWREAKSLYDDQYYFFAWRSADRAKKHFPGDLRVISLLDDLEAKINEARQSAQNVLNRKTSVKDFYDAYIDCNEFESDINKRIKKAILEDLKNRLVTLSREERRRMIIAARENVLQDEPEYHDLIEKYCSGITPDQSHTQEKTNADWSRIIFYPLPRSMDITLHIEGHDQKAPNTAYIRCQDEVHLQVSQSSDPHYSRKARLTVKPWTAYQIKINPSCFEEKKAQVQIVKKGWPIKRYDLDAMADQITKKYQIDKAKAVKSLQVALDKIENKENITTLQVPLIGCWQDEQFMELMVRE